MLRIANTQQKHSHSICLCHHSGRKINSLYFLHHFNIQKLTDLPTVDELSSAGLIDTDTIDSSIFGTGKFYKEQTHNKKEDIYSNIEKAIDETPKSD